MMGGTIRTGKCTGWIWQKREKPDPLFALIGIVGGECLVDENCIIESSSEFLLTLEYAYMGMSLMFEAGHLNLVSRKENGR